MEKDDRLYDTPEAADRRTMVRRQLADRYFEEKARPRRPKRRLIRLWVILLCLFGYGFFLDTVVSMPDNAWVYVDERAGVYYAPTYLLDTGRDVRGLIPAPAVMAKARHYQPDPTAKAQGYFRQAGRSMSGGLLEKLGVLAPLKSRWNLDGTWNW